LIGGESSCCFLPSRVISQASSVLLVGLLLQQLEEIVRKAADPKGGTFGLLVNMAAPLYAAQALRSWSSNPTKSTEDAWLITRDGKKQQLDSPPIKAGYEWYRKMIGDGLVPTSGEQQAMAGSGVDHFVAGKMVARAAEMTTPHTWKDKIKFRMEQRLWVKGPQGHRGSALSYNNHAIFSKTKVQNEAWKLLAELTGPEIAFAVGFEGIGQPGARRSAWFNPKIWEKYPIMEEGAKWFEGGIDPYPRPANLRAQEHQEIYSQEIQAYLDGKETWEQMFPRVQKRGQEIIDLPPP
jgi:ABC-type glycerol-3-phosphate transport system substrate-binding protein